MRWTTSPAGISVALALLCIAGGFGCARSDAEAREARNRHLRRAIAAKNAQDVDRAIELCEQALARQPDLALAHRELGLMLDNFRQDHVAALYHYRRYLELRPDSKHREDVEQLIRHGRTAFAAQVAAAPDEMQRGLQARDARIAELELEVVVLRERLAAVAPASAPRADRASPPPPPAAASAQTHVVQTGENLATISSRYYGTPSKWKKIFGANQDRLTDANNVRVGTKLVIPPE